MKKENEFKPYISADTVTKEFSATAFIAGILLAVVFGAANAYLGLLVGMTVSASIPAAVIGMGVIKVIMRKNSILESNMIQTIGSAGESLAAGVIFTVPAMFLWAAEGKTEIPGILEITVIAFAGGVLGILFMIPLRKALIVKEHGVLPYPEGMACSEVLLAGEKGGSQSAIVFISMGVSAILKFALDGLKIAKGSIDVVFTKFKGQMSIDVYPALAGVGYICGYRISATLFAGGVLSWLVLIPLICLFGGDTILFPGTVTITEIWNTSGAAGIWSNYIRYIGAGAVAAGGIISLVKSLPTIINTFKESMKGLKGSKGQGVNSVKRTEAEIPMPYIIAGVVAVMIAIAAFPQIPVGFVGSIFIVIFGFFFATVASRMVGLVGSSNNPVSGMTIATLLITALIYKIMGKDGMSGMLSVMTIGAIIAIIASIAGDTSQDLKTGYIIGATPKKQQIGELIGVAVSAVTIGGVMYLLNAAWGFGSTQLAAPQATLMKMIVEGVMGNELPWNLVFVGVFIAVIAELVGIASMPFAIGLYLPIASSACIMLGGIVRAAVEYKLRKKDAKEKDAIINKGILSCSGLIAGEGLIGILLAVFAIAPFKSGTIADAIDMSGTVNLGKAGALIALGIIVYIILKYTIWSKEEK